MGSTKWRAVGCLSMLLMNQFTKLYNNKELIWCHISFVHGGVCLMMVLMSSSFIGGNGRFEETYSFLLQSFSVTLGEKNKSVEANCSKED